jgi:hypothetical protein
MRKDVNGWPNEASQYKIAKKQCVKSIDLRTEKAIFADEKEFILSQDSEKPGKRHI